MNAIAISKSSSKTSSILPQYENQNSIPSIDKVDSSITSPAHQSLSEDFYSITSSTSLPSDPIARESKQFGNTFDFCGCLFFSFCMVIFIQKIILAISILVGMKPSLKIVLTLILQQYSKPHQLQRCYKCRRAVTCHPPLILL